MLNSNILSTPALRFQEALSKVFHDATLYGDGTRSNPLRIIGGGTLPDQTGHAGEFLTTDGSVLSWDAPGGGGAYIPLDATSLGLTGMAGDFTWETSEDLLNGFIVQFSWNKEIAPATGIISSRAGNLLIVADNALFPSPKPFLAFSSEDQSVLLGISAPDDLSNGNINFSLNGAELKTFSDGVNRILTIPFTSGIADLSFANDSGGYDFDSTTGGLVVPRMDGTQISALVSPMNGGVLYDTDLHKVKVFLNGGWYTVLDSSITLGLDKGGTSASLSASNGGIFYSTATAGAILSGTATASKMLLSGATAAPTWSTSTIPTSAGATTGKTLVSDGTNYILSDARFLNSGITTTQAYTVGNSSSDITLGGSTGRVFVTSSDTTSTAVSIYTSGAGSAMKIYNSDNGASASIGIRFGNAISFTQTSSTRSYIDCNWGFAPTSGTAVHNQFAFTGTFNQTGGANGITRGIYFNKTMTAVADYRAIEIAENAANVKGIYQSGTTTTNVLAGNTGFGATTAPTAKVMLAAGTTSANTAPLKFTSGTNLTTPEAGAVEFDGTNYFVTSSSTRYTLAKTLTATATLDFPNTVRLNSSDLTITVTGAAVGDAVILGIANASVVTDGIFTAWVSAANTVTVRFTNVGLTLDRDPASGTFRVSVLKY